MVRYREPWAYKFIVDLDAAQDNSEPFGAD